MAVHLISRARYFRPLLLVSVPHFLSTLTTAFKLLLGIFFSSGKNLKTHQHFGSFFVLQLK